MSCHHIRSSHVVSDYSKTHAPSPLGVASGTVSEGGLLCGGEYTADSCLQWSPDSGTWEEALTLDVKRWDHVSWTPSSGNTRTYLMGGWKNEMTTTLIKNDGSWSQEPGFVLKYDTQ